MVVAEELQGGAVVRHYSDQGVMIRKVEDGTLWPDAVDIVPCQYTYEETDVPVPDEDISPEELLEIILGGVNT